MKNTNQRIGCCGLDCEACDARIATITNDNALREKTAALWTKLNGLDTCADCGQMDGCPTLGQIAGNSPFVLENLKQLKQDNA